MNIKKNNTLFAVIIILLVSLIILLVGYIVYNKLDNNKDEITLIKAEKDALVKNEVDALVKLLNSDSNLNNICGHFGVQSFELSENENLLDYFSPLLMSCRYGLDYVEVKDYSPVNPKSYLMTEGMYNKFKEYFNTKLDETTTIDNVSYYVAVKDWDGYAIRQYNFELVGNITENNDVYSVMFNIIENPEAFGISESKTKMVGTAELKLSIKSDHIYYKSFKIVNIQ